LAAISQRRRLCCGACATASLWSLWVVRMGATHHMFGRGRADSLTPYAVHVLWTRGLLTRSGLRAVLLGGLPTAPSAASGLT
jgi:hypothetical protein